jgi:sulfatase maturation enzyme AslB (radical SAM superfamily)
MSWPTARAALDFVLAGGPAKRAVELSGGEPTLEPALVRRCVEYLRSAAPPGVAVDCSLTTNGTLLGDELLAFLADHDVGLDLSFDGVPAAQKFRGAGSFPTLDRLLMRARDQHPQYFDRRVTIRLVVERRTLPLLAESVRYFLGRGVRRIAVAPCLTSEPGWGPAEEGILCEQLDAIVAASLQQLDSTGAVPVSFLIGTDREPGSGSTGLHCAAVSGRCACVDAAGQVWGCPLFTRSLRRLPPLAEGAAELVSLGSVHDPSLAARLAGLPERARCHPLFSTASRSSGPRRCSECEHAADCNICPDAICESGQGLDPQEVPAFHCAFNRLTLEARRRFRDMRVKAGATRCPTELAAALREVTAALRSTAPGTPSPRI